MIGTEFVDGTYVMEHVTRGTISVQLIARGGRENCETFTADSVAHPMKWRGRSELPAATFVTLHFFLRKAELFSFQFVD